MDDPQRPSTAELEVDLGGLSKLYDLDEVKVKLVLAHLDKDAERQFQARQTSARHRLWTSLCGFGTVILLFALSWHLVDVGEAGLAVTCMCVAAVSLSVIYVLGKEPQAARTRFTGQQVQQPAAPPVI